MIKTILKEKAEAGDSLYRMEFFLDSEADAADLPTQKSSGGAEKCATGSIALTLKPDGAKSHLRILDSKGTWQEVGA